LVSGDFNMKALLAIVEGQSNAIRAKRVVFDALDVLMRIFDNPNRERSEMYALNEWLLDHQMTAIITVKAFENNNILGRYDFLEFMADCVIRVTQRPGEWVSTRDLQVIKYRGSDFGRNAYPFVIQPDGISVIPISEFGLKHQALGPYISSGNKQIDLILGGGPGLNVSNLNHNSFTCTSKTGERKYRCQPALINAMRDLADQNGFIFTTSTGQVMTSHYLAKHVTLICKQAGITERK
jgi:circadian clock protein KaiC